MHLFRDLQYLYFTNDYSDQKNCTSELNYKLGNHKLVDACKCVRHILIHHTYFLEYL